jgi:hypothetical protein
MLVIFPVSPCACLVAGAQGNDYRSIDSKIVEEVNRSLAASLSREAYSRTRSQKLVAAVDDYGGSYSFGRNAFVMPGYDYSGKFKETIRDQLMSDIRRSRR